MLSSNRQCPGLLAVVAVVALSAPATAREIHHRVELAPEAVAVQDDGRVVVTSDDRFVALEEAGRPALPYRIVNIVLPSGYVYADFTAVVSPAITLRASYVGPNAFAQGTAHGELGSSPQIAQERNHAFPGEHARYLGTGFLHGVAIASFAVYPLRVIDGQLALSTSIDIVLNAEPGVSDRTIRQRHRAGFPEKIHGQIASFVDNDDALVGYSFGDVVVGKKRGGFQATTFPSLEGSPVDYVIITNDSLASAFQVLANWKTVKGVPTVVRTTEWIDANYRNGVDQAETIRNFVIDAYQKWGITYVLLGGDTDQIPVRFGATNYLLGKDVPVDMYYGCLDGDWNLDHDNLFGEPGLADSPDLYQEVYVGRLPATDVPSANVLVSKIMAYETPGDATYARRVLSLAEVLFPSSWNEGETIAIDGANLAEFLYLLAWDDPARTYITKKYENETAYPGSVDETVQCSIDSINAGYNFVNHIGHGFRFNVSVGNGSILNSDADAFTNGTRCSNFYLLNCTAVAYTYFCLAEHLLKNPAGGAVSVIGANESAFPLGNQPYMNEYYHLLFNQDVVHIGEAFARSRLPRTPLAQTGDNGDLWVHYIYTLLADPEMQLWTADVELLTVTCPDSVSLGTSMIAVNVSATGGPVAGALVCLSKGADDYEIGTTDSGGNVSLEFTSESPGQIDVVVTGINCARYENQIVVDEPATAYVSWSGTAAVDDDALGGTVGNADGRIDAGETVDLLFSVTNSGDIAANNITMALRTVAPFVTIIDSVVSVGNIAPAGTAQAMQPFRVAFGPQIADEETVRFSLAVRESGVDKWMDTMARSVHAPALEVSVLRIDDIAFGNGDGVIQDSEIFDLYFKVKNYGTGAASGLNAVLADLGNGFVFVDSLDTYDDIAGTESGEGVGGFRLLETNTLVESQVQLSLTDAYGRTTQHTSELRRPDAPSALALDSSLGPDRLEITWAAGPSPDVDRYNIYRSVAPGGPYALANPDPVYHTIYIDRGLASTTRFYYVVVSVDASGNESAVSTEGSGSTSAAQVEGWPITTIANTVCSPVVGDIDGDGDFEVVQGNHKIYAWHHDAVEMIDKDGNAQTWGLLSQAGNSYVSHPALSDVDSIPGLDIIAASRDTREVYVFDYNGDPLPGWPRPVENAIRAGLVAGDIDGDGTKEIIAIDEKGVLYVWNPNGTEKIDGDATPGTQGVFRRFSGCSYQYTSPAIADLDMDGFNEIIIGTQGDSVYVLNGDGSNMPGWPRGFSSDISGSIAVGDIDGDGGGDLEIIVCEWGGLVHALHHNGTTLWVNYFQNQLSFAPSPAIGDLNGDGRLETIVASKNRNLYAITYQGNNLPGWPVVYTSQLWTESSPVIADIDGDGSQDVVLGDETRYINAWNVTGSLLAGFPLAAEDAVRATPCIADLDKDGDVDLIVAGWDTKVYVWDFPKRFDPRKADWTSFHGNIYNDGNSDTKVPTSVSGASYSVAFIGEQVQLVWQMPSVAGYRFEMDRAEVKEDTALTFARVASDLLVDMTGRLTFTDRHAVAGSRYVYRLRSADDAGVSAMTTALYVPVRAAVLEQNYPNPFNPETRIWYSVPEGRRQGVELVIYDVRGARVRSLVSEQQSAGRYEARWDGRNDAGASVSSGVYFYRMVQASGFVATRKMVLLK